MKPKLVHPVDVVLKNVDLAASNVDTRFGEPETEVKYGPEFTIRGQVRYNQFKAMDGYAPGFEQKGQGHIVVENEDADKIHLNARIVSIDGVQVEYFVTEMIPKAHYQNHNFKFVVFDTQTKGLINAGVR